MLHVFDGFGTYCVVREVATSGTGEDACLVQAPQVIPDIALIQVLFQSVHRERAACLCDETGEAQAYRIGERIELRGDLGCICGDGHGRCSL